MRRPLAGILLIAALLVGGGVVAATAYQAGLSTAVTTVVQNPAHGTTGTVVVPGGYGFGYGHGWGPGFGFLGFLGTFLFIILIVGLLRAVFGVGRGRHGWGGPGSGPWVSHGHERFEDWHRDAHAGATAPGPAPDTRPNSADRAGG